MILDQRRRKRHKINTSRPFLSEFPHREPLSTDMKFEFARINATRFRCFCQFSTLLYISFYSLPAYCIM